jgi:hypothetical protein
MAFLLRLSGVSLVVASIIRGAVTLVECRQNHQQSSDVEGGCTNQTQVEMGAITSDTNSETCNLMELQHRYLA